LYTVSGNENWGTSLLRLWRFKC